jgi:hypothetical protein
MPRDCTALPIYGLNMDVQSAESTAQPVEIQYISQYCHVTYTETNEEANESIK